MNVYKVKMWVVIHSTVTNPNKKYFSASVTLGGYDINGTGDTIEKAYLDLVKLITASDYSMQHLQRSETFKNLKIKT